MELWGSNWKDELLVFCLLLAVLNSITFIFAIGITVYKALKLLPFRGLLIYWNVTLLILIISLCIKDAEKGLRLYCYLSPVLLLLLCFNKRFNEK